MKQYTMAKPYIRSQEERAVLKVLRSGVLSLGPYTKEFETKFAKLIGTKYACAVSSGTAGLHLCLLAAGIGEGDEVITSPFSFVSSANALLYVGAKPIFVDVDPQSFNMDPSLIEARITKKTKALLVVHIFGQSADMTPIMRIAKKYRLKIIEDACESPLAKYKGKVVGMFGESGVFAFYPNKQMTTGEGGMIVTNDKDIALLCKSLANQGRGDDIQWLDHVRLGYNYRMDEMSAALGVTQLTRLPSLIRTRQRIALWYTRAFKGYEHLLATPVIMKHSTHSWFVYAIRILNPRINRDEMIMKLKTKGIASKPYLPSIHLLSFYKKKYRLSKGAFPISEMLSNSLLALPLAIDLTQRDVQYISSVIVKELESYAHPRTVQKRI